MSDMKCPICNKPMQISYPSASGYHYCYNCGISSGGIAYKALERTRKALDVAVDALKRTDWCAQDYAIAQEALNKITALEQITALEEKDKNYDL